MGECCLKDYILRGYAVNENRLRQLEEMIGSFNLVFHLIFYNRAEDAVS